MAEKKPAGAQRPIGFRSARPTAAEAKPKREEEPPRRKKRGFPKPHLRLKSKQTNKRRVRKPSAKRSKARIRVKDLLLTAACVIVVAAVIFGIVYLVNHGKTVHQMPTILRITEEPTREPEEAAMLRGTNHTGAIPSPDGIRA